MLSLASCTFGLVEWVEAQRPTGDRGRELGEEHDPTEVRGAVNSERDRRVAGPRQASDRLILVVVGLVDVAQVNEHAVLAVGLRTSERLVGHGQDAPTPLAGRLGHELLGPKAEGLDRMGDDESELVPALAGQRPERRIPAPDAPRDSGGGGLPDGVGNTRLELVRDRALDRGRALGDDRLAPSAPVPPATRTESDMRSPCPVCRPATLARRPGGPSRP